MSWRIAADLREMFAEVAATNGHQTILCRTLNRKDLLHNGLTEALNLLPNEIKSEATQLSLRADFDRVSLRERWGSPTALVCTEGFENLNAIADQRREKLFGLAPFKKTALIPKELAFGVTERTRVDGSIELELNEKEIDFVISKLLAVEVKTVAICFLHSNVNATHEKQLEKKLKDHGFTVVASHAFSGHERERAEQACTEAFLTQGRLELAEAVAKLGFSPQQIQFLPKGPFAENQLSKNETVIAEFLEDRFTIGGVPLKSLSPLSRVILDEGGHVHFGPAPEETEPGPISFGKGIQLCLLDLLLINFRGSPVGLPRLKFDLSRPAKQLAPLAQQLRMTPESALTQFIDLAGVMVAEEIATLLPEDASRLMTAQGWLARALAPLVSRYRGHVPIQVSMHAEWARPLNLLKEHGKQVEVVGGAFTFEGLS